MSNLICLRKPDAKSLPQITEIDLTAACWIHLIRRIGEWMINHCLEHSCLILTHPLNSLVSYLKGFCLHKAKHQRKYTIPDHKNGSAYTLMLPKISINHVPVFPNNNFQGLSIILSIRGRLISLHCPPFF